MLTGTPVFDSCGPRPTFPLAGGGMIVVDGRMLIEAIFMIERAPAWEGGAFIQKGDGGRLPAAASPWKVAVFVWKPGRVQRLIGWVPVDSCSLTTRGNRPMIQEELKKVRLDIKTATC